MPTVLPDALIASAARLRILTALVSDRGAALDFVNLRSRTGLTDGNLSTHARRLEHAGLVRIEKTFRDRKPVTHVQLTPPGRKALEDHAKELLTALNATHETADSEAAVDERAGASRDDWID